MPEDYIEWGQSWLIHHPNWKMKLWTEENLPPSRFPELVKKCKWAAQQADLYRYEVVSKFGGVYVDCDFECLANIESIIDEKEFFSAFECDDMNHPNAINNAFFGSVPNHPMLDSILDEIPRVFDREEWVTAGPMLLTRIVKQRQNGVLKNIFPRKMFYPYLWDELHRKKGPFPGSYAAHHWGSSVMGRVLVKEKVVEMDAVMIFNNMESIFTNIIKSGAWSVRTLENPTPCGPGSFVDSMLPVIKIFPEILRKFAINFITDLGCGDFNWMSQVDLGGTRYFGYDIVKSLVDEANKKYQRHNISFGHMNILDGYFPWADLIICKDVMNHLPTAMCATLISKIKAKEIKLFASITSPDVMRNMDINVGGFRRINFLLPPFSLGEPIIKIKLDDEAHEDVTGAHARTFAIWNLS